MTEAQATIEAASSADSAAQAHAALRHACPARRPHGAVRGLRDAGAVSRRHHRRAHAHAHRRRPVRRLAHGPGVSRRAGSRDGRARARSAGARRHPQSRARPPALHATAQRRGRHPRRSDGHALGRSGRGRRADAGRQRVAQGRRLRAYRSAAAGGREAAARRASRADRAAGTAGRRRDGAARARRRRDAVHVGA